MTQNIQLKRYQKDFDHSYCLGVYPTLELLQFQPEIAQGVILHSKGRDNQGVRKIKGLVEELDLELIENDRLVNKLAVRGNTYAIGVFQKFSSRLKRTKNHLVLVHPSSMGNLGTIMRSMLGFGFQQLAIIKPAADPFDPKTIRASMGALFQLNLQTFNNFSDYWGRYKEHNLYPLMTNGKESLPEITFKHPYSIIFGEETSGLPNEFLQYGTSICIPQSPAVDSLNLALAVGICLYHSWIQKSN
jgi:TrmH family RNA methyltransferase